MPNQTPTLYQEKRLSPEFRVDPATGVCTVRGPVYPSFDPVDGRVYTIAEIQQCVDSWGTFIAEADVRALSESYMIQSQFVDRMHDGVTPAGRVVESTVANSTPSGYPTPTWCMGVRVDGAVAPDVRSGILRGFSIEVLSRRQRYLITVEGNGTLPDLTDVTAPPFYPHLVQVSGRQQIAIDRLTLLRPVSVSLVDRPAIGQDFATEQRTELVLRCVPDGESPATEIRAVVPYEKTPESKDDDWDASAAVKRLRSWSGVDDSEPTAAAWKRYARGFTLTTGDADKFGDFLEPHHDIESDDLVLNRAGLAAAAARLDQVDASDDELKGAAEHLAHHYRDLDAEVPPALGHLLGEDKKTALSEDEKPATRGWLRRTLDEFLGALRRDPIALRSNGEPPPALAAELPPVEEDEQDTLTAQPIVEREQPMSTPTTGPAPAADLVAVETQMSAAVSPSIPTVENVSQRMLAVRFASPLVATDEQRDANAKPWGFASCWEQQETQTNVWAMLSLLGDIVCSRVLYGAITSNEQVEDALTALAQDMSDFLGELRELLQVAPTEEQGGTQMVTARQAAMIEMVTTALATLQPEVLVQAFGGEQRAGKKHSKETVEQLRRVMSACREAYEQLREMVGSGGDDGEDDATDQSDEQGGEADADAEKRTAPVVTVPAGPTATERELRLKLVEKDRLLAEREARIAQLERDAEVRRCPSAQPAMTAQSTESRDELPADDDWRRRIRSYDEQTRFGVKARS